MAREQERAALHKTIWQMANELRGSVDGWDFKQYVGVIVLPVYKSKFDKVFKRTSTYVGTEL